MMTRILATCSLVVSLAAPVMAQPAAERDHPLATARDLYASARYDEALAVLNGLRPGDAGLDRKSIEQYRSLCLLALGRGTEAEAAIAAVVTADPLFQPNESDASPRVRTAFSDVRQRMLPDIATSRYADAKGSFDRKEYAVAEERFREVLRLLEDPQMAGRHSDLLVLAAGFLELSAKAAAPPPPPPSPAPEPRKEDPPPSPPTASVRPVGPYSSSDAGVTPPVALRQALPRVQPSIAGQARDHGYLEVTIDEQGRVSALTLRKSVHPLYDPILLAAARDWRYKPAVMNGVPVTFRKVIQIQVQR